MSEYLTKLDFRGDAMKRFLMAAAVALASVGGSAGAAVVTFEATISNFSSGGANIDLLLADLGITLEDTLTVRFSIETDQSSGYTNYEKRTDFEGFKLSSANKTIDVGASNSTDGLCSISEYTCQLLLRDGVSDGSNFSDLFLLDLTGEIEPDFKEIHRLYIRTVDENSDYWSRGDPITAALFNGMSNEVAGNSISVFEYSAFYEGQLLSIFAYDIEFSVVPPLPPGCGPSGGVPPKCNPDISAVPLPAALPLLVAGLGGLGFIGRRKKKKAA